MRDPEYDHFGPWVLEITDEDPPPPLFLPYLTRTEEPLTSIKIPRKIERRKAYPGMNLYDYMVSLYEEDVVILERIGSEVAVHTFPYSDIQTIGYLEELLKGTLRLVLPDQVYDLPFSTVSKDTMGHIVDLIRQRYTAASSVTLPESAQIDPKELSFYFSRLLAQQEADNSQFRLLAAQPNKAVGSFETEALRKLLFGAISKTLLESLHFCDGRELKIFNRSKIFKYRWQTIYGKATYTLPLDKIQDVSWQKDEKNAAVTHLLLQTGGEPLALALIQDNPILPTYQHFLAALPGPAKADKIPVTQTAM